MTAVARCTACRAEFTEAQIEGATACPACGSKGVPMDPRKDVTIRINPHELRILTFWASNWAAKECEEGSRLSLRGILAALKAQEPLQGVALTMFDEGRALAVATGSDVEIVDGVGTLATFKGSKPA